MENSNNIIQKPLQLPELIASLEQATLMAKQLPFTNTAAAAPAVNPSVLHQIYSSLHTAHHRLSSFLFSSSSSDTNNNTDTNTNAAAEPMQFDDDNQEADSKHNNSNNDDDIMIENVEERLRNCFIKNKRPKRPLSPSYYAAAAAAEDERRSREVGDGGMRGLGLGLGYDPMETRLNALELVYQFHG